MREGSNLQHAASRRPCCPIFGTCLAALLALEAGLILVDPLGWAPVGKGALARVAIVVAAASIAMPALGLCAARLLSWRFQYGVRSLLVLAVAVAAPCSWLATTIAQAKRQAEAVEALRRIGCRVEHEPPVDPDALAGLRPATDDSVRFRLPSSLVRLLGVDFFASVVSVDNTPIDGAQLGIVADSDMKSLRALGSLRRLALDFQGDLLDALGSEEAVSDDGIKNLRGDSRLQLLDLSGTQVTDAGLKHLSGLAQLEQLGLARTRVSDAGLTHLQALPKLRVLVLAGTQVSDAGRKRLRGSAALREMDFDGPLIACDAPAAINDGNTSRLGD